MVGQVPTSVPFVGTGGWRADRRERGDDGWVSSAATPRAVFRVSPLTVLFAFALGVCAIPVAFGAPYLWLIYLVPVAVVVWTLRTRTVVDTDGMRVRRLVGGGGFPGTPSAGCGWTAATPCTLS